MVNLHIEQSAVTWLDLILYEKNIVFIILTCGVNK